MSDWTPEERDLFDAARSATSPTRGEKARVERSLALELGAAAFGAAPLSRQALTTAARAPGAAGSSGAALIPGALKIAGGALLLGAAALGVRQVAWHPSSSGAAAVSQSIDRGEPESLAPESADDTAQKAAVETVAPAEPRREATPPSASRGQRASEPAAHDAIAVSSLKQETELLKAAQRALGAGQHTQAMSLLDEHAKRFPAGSLREERKAARIFVLCASGRAQKARLEADAFAREWPSSPLLDHVRSACGAGAKRE